MWARTGVCSFHGCVPRSEHTYLRSRDPGDYVWQSSGGVGGRRWIPASVGWQVFALLRRCRHTGGCEDTSKIGINLDIAPLRSAVCCGWPIRINIKTDNKVLKLYGIPNCDTCRKARQWLDDNNVEHVFHDLRQDGLEIQMLERWASQVDWVTLLNTRSTTWRNLPAKDRNDVTKTRAMALMLEHPTLVKRPIFENSTFFAVGFSTRRTDELLKKLRPVQKYVKS